MSDFVTRLAQRQLGQLTTVEPRLPSLFAASVSTAPMPVVDDITTTWGTSPQFANLALPRVDSSAAGVAGSEEVSTTDAASKTIERLAWLPRETPPNLLGSAQEPAISTHRPMAAHRNDKQIVMETRPPVQSQTASPGSHTNFALPLAPQAAAPLTGRESPGKQNRSERTAPAPLVEIRPPKPTNAPPRLDAKMSNRVELSAREGAASDPEPPVHVTIGRIEVTALTRRASATASARAQAGNVTR